MRTVRCAALCCGSWLTGLDVLGFDAQMKTKFLQ